MQIEDSEPGRWSLGVVADAIVIAAALSVQDVFVMASPQNARRPEDFPALLARNYTVRDKFSAGQYSEPIMCAFAARFLQSSLAKITFWMLSCCII